MLQKLKFPILVGLLSLIIFFLYKNNQTLESINNKSNDIKIEETNNQEIERFNDVKKKESNNQKINTSNDLKINSNKRIDKLSSEEVVVPYLIKNGELPDYYIKKGEAKNEGWVPSKGNLCEVLPNRVIGGDNFSNREGNLPKESGRKYFEADINYNCGHRGADRIVYSNDGLIFVTHDHYKTFDKK